ncbi:MAG: hypothetical protein SVG88_00710 [Halobacteriales archaeon]|nr:hypothetical protein [Halobacteriales archaeon]
MRSDTLPTGSVTGRDGWDWENPVPDDDQSGTDVDGQPTPTRPHARIAELEAEVATLRTALHRKDDQLQSVIDRYEALLEERTARTASTRGSTTDHGLRDWLRRLRDTLFVR